MLRYLTERLPVMVTPTWVRTRIQPIAIRDVLHYLVAAAELPAHVSWAGGALFVDERERRVDASVEALWHVIEGIGGERGWYSFPLAWRLRGRLDRLSGGPGLRRGRRDPDDLFVGESVDFWRVEEVDEPHLLRLRAEMRLPGLARLELRVRTGDDGRVVFSQRALFHPKGLAGQVYWWSVWPFHGIVFGEMQRNIARAAEALDAESAAWASVAE